MIMRRVTPGRLAVKSQNNRGELVIYLVPIESPLVNLRLAQGVAMSIAVALMLACSHQSSIAAEQPVVERSLSKQPAAAGVRRNKNTVLPQDRLNYNDRLQYRDKLKNRDDLKPQHVEKIRSRDKLKPEHVERIRAERDKLNFERRGASGRRQ